MWVKPNRNLSCLREEEKSREKVKGKSEYTSVDQNGSKVSYEYKQVGIYRNIIPICSIWGVIVSYIVDINHVAVSMSMSCLVSKFVLHRVRVFVFFFFVKCRYKSNYYSTYYPTPFFGTEILLIAIPSCNCKY